MGFPETGVDTLTDDSLGRVKGDKPGQLLESLEWDVPAEEYNRVRNALIRTQRAVLAGELGSQVITAAYGSGPYVLADTTGIARINVDNPGGDPPDVTVSQPTGGRQLWLDVRASGDDRVYLRFSNGDAGQTEQVRDGLWLAVAEIVGGDAGVSWVVRRILETGDLDDLLERAQAGELDHVATYTGATDFDWTTRAHIVALGGYSLVVGDSTEARDGHIMLASSGTVTLDGTAAGITINGTPTWDLVGNSYGPSLFEYIFVPGTGLVVNVFATRAELAGFATDAELAAVQADVDAHEANTSNPHAVTAAQAGAVPTARTVTAGAGLTGGGPLSGDVTLNVIAHADGSIVANANDVQVGVLATDAQHGVRGGGTQHSAATTSAAGFMAAADKTAVDAHESSLDVSTSTATIDGTYGIYRATYSAGTCALTIDATKWPIGASRKIVKDNISSNLVTLAPPSGGTVQGGATNAVMTLPGSSSTSVATTGGRTRWTVTRTASLTYVVAGGEVVYTDGSAAAIPGPFQAQRLRSNTAGTAADVAVRVGTNSGRGFYDDAVKGLVAAVDGVDRIKSIVGGTNELVSYGGVGIPPLRLVTNGVNDVNVFVSAASPEGVVTASIGDICVDATNGRLYIKRTGSGTTGWVQIDRCESGSYTPTATAVSNVDIVTPGLAFWVRVGDVVLQVGRVDIDPTAAGAASVRLSLAVASNFAATTDAAGVVGGISLNAGGSRVDADATNDQLLITINTAATVSNAHWYVCGYRVL